MEVIALTGQYDAKSRALLKEMVPPGFILKEVSRIEDYDQLQDANYIILRILGLKEADINAIPKLKLIQRWGVGYEKVDVQAAGKRNIPVAVTPGMNAAAVSEMAVLLMLAVYRNLLQLDKNVRAGKWQEGTGEAVPYTIQGKTVGLVGFGNIARMVAQKVQAFGAKVQYYDAVRLPLEDEEKLGVCFVSLEELLQSSDIISLHVPLLDSTRHLIRRETLQLMKPSAIIVNTARGAIIREADLVEAIQAGQLLGAGLDCLETEPGEPDNPLYACKRVVLTPHLGGSAAEISFNMAKRCMENIVKISRQESLPATDVVNTAYFKK